MFKRKPRVFTILKRYEESGTSAVVWVMSRKDFDDLFRGCHVFKDTNGSIWGALDTLFNPVKVYRQNP